MPESIWYYALDDEEQGPITSAELKELAASGKLSADDLVWRDGMEDWSPASEVKGLKFKEPDAPPVVASQEPTQNPPRDNAPPPADSPPKKASRFKEFDADEPSLAAAPEVSPAPAPAAERSPPPQRSTEVAVNEEPSSPPSLARAAQQPDLMTYVRLGGLPFLAVGLFIVLMVRGCDGIGDRYVTHAQSAAQVAESEFQYEWDRKRMALENEKTAITEKTTLSADDNNRLLELNDQLSKLDEERDETKSQLERGKWLELRATADLADARYKQYAYFRQYLFVFGTFLLTIGLLTVGFAGQGAERWICLVIIAIILYSLYVGGTAWGGI